MNIMDASQISDLLDWTAANSPELIPERETLAGQAASFVNRAFEHDARPETLPNSCNYFPGITNMAGFVPVSDISPHLEQVPMDDYDPLESFSFWDGENFYTNQEYNAVCSPRSDVNSDVLQFSGCMIDEDSLGRNEMIQSKGPNLLLGNNPTLAELNSLGETPLDYTMDNSFMYEDGNNSVNVDALSKSLPSNDHLLSYLGNTATPNNSPYFVSTACVPATDTRSNLQAGLISSSCPTSSTIFCPQYLTVCDEKLLVCPQNSPASDSFFMKQPDSFIHKLAVPMNDPVSVGTMFINNKLPDSNLLSSSAPPDVTMSSVFCKVKVEGGQSMAGFGHKTLPISERSLSAFSSLSLSNDDESGSYFDDSDRDEDDDFSSDEDIFQYESDEILSTSWPPGGKDVKSPSQRKTRYFWQYNLQSRGVKTPSLLPVSESGDPLVLNDALDPVFAEECSLPVKHSGKARKGDGNDLTPNPYKLFKIGVELKKLNRLIYSLNPACESSDPKPLSRKEKNKLASRVCRLKKKAQHEANKIKLYGLQQEHKKLVSVILETRQLIHYKVKNFHKSKNLSCSQWLESYLLMHDPHKVAEKSSEFVNVVLEKVAKGEYDGGLGKL